MEPQIKKNLNEEGARSGPPRAAEPAADGRCPLLPPLPREQVTAEPRQKGTMTPRTARTVERRAIRDGEFNWCDHRSSCRHKDKFKPRRLPRCVDCNHEFESDEHYYRHLRGKSHMKTVS